ncbi:unnamed protein product [Euphydryas editha]|uniref:Nuclease HARBI1 n=1 Tax=Euphydryas editha TaxID=104508 RepID=A0AAU9TPQ8_EUPED|nr:unnamed protein product [Euphydryas editha]
MASEEDLKALKASRGYTKTDIRRLQKFLSNENEVAITPVSNLVSRKAKLESTFLEYERMSLHKFNELVQIMQPYIKREDTLFRKAIGVEEKLMVTMRYLATGDSFKTIAESFRLGYTTVQEIIHTTCPALWEVLSKMVMPIPDEEKWKKIEKEFNEKWNYPNCIGALDGKHVEILSPPKSGSTILSDVVSKLGCPACNTFLDTSDWEDCDKDRLDSSDSRSSVERDVALSVLRQQL